MADKRLLASLALAAGLVGGGAAGMVLGVPGVSGAQTTTVPDQPATTVPGVEGGQTDPDRPPRADGENCPEKDGQGSGTSGSSTNAGFRRGPGGGGRV